MNLTGAAADRYLAIRRTEIPAVAVALAERLGAAGADGTPIDDGARRWIETAASDLLVHRGEALVVAGEAQPAEVHALVHWMNHRLGAFDRLMEFIEPVEANHDAPGLAPLCDEMRAGAVDALLIVGANPVYDAPADCGFHDALVRVPFSVSHGLFEDETAAATTWHVAALHGLESWGDVRAVDGNTTIVQPLIRPLYDCRSPYALFGALLGREQSDYATVRDYWRGVHPTDFESWWRKTLHDGFVAGSASSKVVPTVPKLVVPELPPAAAGLEISFAPDNAVYDGRHADNAWLQELPRPLSKMVWGNAAAISATDAARLGFEDGDVARLSRGDRAIEIPVHIAVGQASGSVALALGYGRSRAGTIGSGIGVDVYPLRGLASMWALTGVQIERTGRRQHLATTQTHHMMSGRDIVRTIQMRELGSTTAKEGPPPSLYPDYPRQKYEWGMVIDQSVCIGCNACVVACQAENNIAVVGPDEVRNGRIMHWLRIDSYFEGPPQSPDVLFQPVPCMHCEKAPCEPVCPVEASVHDSEGLNDQVYNRCVGTRFCQSNCPYKVRRFNFYGYGAGQPYANLGAPIYAAVHNPDVTVRARGVMEKCTYCVQRISRARRKAEQENRPIGAEEVVTACQAACPAEAIIFGNINDRSSRVTRLKNEPHEYALLEHLGTRPRSTYLARVRDAASGKART